MNALPTPSRGTDARWGAACRGSGKRRARVQEGEELTCEPFVVAGAEVKPMMEMVAGSNRWFQATVVRQSEHEVEVSFPRAAPPSIRVSQGVPGFLRVFQGVCFPYGEAESMCSCVNELVPGHRGAAVRARGGGLVPTCGPTLNQLRGCKCVCFPEG